MITLEHFVGPSPEQMEFVIEGMRNPKNSWNKSDSDIYSVQKNADGMDFEVSDFSLGKDDHQLMLQLAKAGTDHRKYMRMMIVMVRITAPLYWWKEFDTYKVGTVANSCSTMHKIQDKEFTIEDFSCEHTLNLNNSGASFDYDIPQPDPKNSNETKIGHMRTVPFEMMGMIIEMLNVYRHRFLKTKDKKYWWQMIQLLPSSYNQTRNVMLNYEVLANIYKSRKNHKLDEWRDFCEWIEHLPWSELICQWSEEELKQTDEKLKEEIENGDFRKYMNEPTNELIGDNDNMDARR